MNLGAIALVCLAAAGILVAVGAKQFAGRLCLVAVALAVGGPVLASLLPAVGKALAPALSAIASVVGIVLVVVVVLALIRAYLQQRGQTESNEKHDKPRTSQKRRIDSDF